ncbi:MAG: translocation/assembly module TamB [Flavobacteriaceae bacterium]|nr:translocation/assembly module TamB [Flavobacteriaceae bacterium]
MANIEKNIEKKEEELSKENQTPKTKKRPLWLRVMLYFLLGVFTVFVALLVVINLPSVKNRIANYAIDLLNKEFKIDLKTENVKIDFFGDVVISGLVVKDHHQFEFIKAKKLVGHSDWWAIISNSRDLKFQKLSLEELDLKVITYKGEEQDNFTLFIEKFDSPKDPKKPPFKFTSRIEIENSKVSIVNENQGEDGKWLKAEKFNAYISELKTEGTNVNLKFNKMSFITERWGKKHFLETLSGDLKITKEIFAFKNLTFNTDHSLLQGDLIFNLDKKTGWQDFNDKVVWDMVVKNGSYLHGYDISYFVNDWDNYQRYNLLGEMKGALNDFKLTDFSIQVNENKFQTPKIEFSQLLAGNFHLKTEKLLADLNYIGLKASLPTFISKKMGGFADEFGRVQYDGLADVNKERVIAQGSLNTGIGKAEIEDFTLSEYSSQFPQYDGNLELKDFNIKAITKKDEVGLISGNFNFDGKGFDLNTLFLNTKSDITSIEILGKKMHNLHIDGDLVAKQFNGVMKADDRHLNGTINGKIDFSQPRFFADLDGDIQHLDLAYWGITKDKSTFRGRFDGRLSMTNVNDLILETQLQNVFLNGETEVKIPNGAIKLTFDDGKRNIKVDVPNIAQGQIVGNFDLGNIGGMFQEAMNKVFVGNKTKKIYKGQNFEMNFDIQQELINYFAPNLKVPNGVKVVGNFFGNTNDFIFDVNTPSLKYIMTEKEEISEADRLLVKTNPEYKISEVVRKDSLMAENIALKINTSVPKEYWATRVERVSYKGSLLKDIKINAEKRAEKLHISTNLQVGTLEKEKKNQMVDYVANIEQSIDENGDYAFRFDPTDLKISKFLWRVDTSPELNHSITYRRKKGDFLIQNLKLYSDDSEALVNGVFKNGKDFDLEGKIKNMDISRVWAIAFQDSKVDLQGTANGEIKLRMDATHLEPDIRINVEDIQVNDNSIGNLSIIAEEIGERNIYDVNVKIKDTEFLGKERLSLKGTIDNNPKSPKLDLQAHLEQFNMAFVQPFVKDVFSNFRGNATGDIAINGTMNDINYGGDVAMKNFGLTLNFSGVDYAFDDTVVPLSNGNMIFNFVGVKDSRSNSKGMISLGQLNLSNFSNIGANLIIRMDDLMLLNTTQRDFDIFWGKIYAKGDMIVGFQNNNLDINATADVLQNSVFTLNSNSTSSVDEFKMLRFLEVNKEGNIAVAERKKSGVGLNINLDISADRSSTVNVLVGDEVGDISVRGNTQNMKFSMNRAGNIRMQGSYEVESGTYISKAILEKQFHIKKGSNLQWNGDVMNPELNITASYNAVVSNASEYLGVGALPALNVELQTKISNKLTSPEVKPYIIASEVSSQIREVMATKLATEEEKVLQFASILAIGNFNVANTNASSAIGSGVNIFFKQLSSAFNSISDDFQIDLDYIRGSESINTGDRATTSLNYKVSPRLKIKTGLGVPLSNNVNTQNNYLSGEGIVEYDWSKTIDGSGIFRVYSKPSNVGLVTGSNAGANQTYGAGVAIAYEFDRFFPKKTQKKKNTQISPKDSIVKDSVK